MTPSFLVLLVSLSSRHTNNCQPQHIIAPEPATYGFAIRCGGDVNPAEPTTCGAEESELTPQLTRGSSKQAQIAAGSPPLACPWSMCQLEVEDCTRVLSCLASATASAGPSPTPNRRRQTPPGSRSPTTSRHRPVSPTHPPSAAPPKPHAASSRSVNLSPRQAALCQDFQGLPSHSRPMIQLPCRHHPEHSHGFYFHHHFKLSRLE